MSRSSSQPPLRPRIPPSRKTSEAVNRGPVAPLCRLQPLSRSQAIEHTVQRQPVEPNSWLRSPEQCGRDARPSDHSERDPTSPHPRFAERATIRHPITGKPKLPSEPDPQRLAQTKSSAVRPNSALLPARMTAEGFWANPANRLPEQGRAGTRTRSLASGPAKPELPSPPMRSTLRRTSPVESFRDDSE